MPSWPAALQLTVFLATPVLFALLERRAKLPGWLSPVVLCYCLGVALGNAGLSLNGELTELVATASVLLGIPLLIVAADFLAWLRLAKTTALASALCFACVCVATLVTAPVFAPGSDDGWIVSGMLVGTYTGSAPNMVAVAQALSAKPETLVLVTTADLIVAGAFCFVLLSPTVRVLRRFLPAFEPSTSPCPEGELAAKAIEKARSVAGPLRVTLAAGIASLAFGLVAVAIAGGLSLLFSKAAEQLVAILAVTTVGIAGSFARRLRTLSTHTPLGTYFILVFCVSFGSLADFRQLLASDSSLRVLLWAASVLVLSVVAFLALCRLFKIDHDTAAIALTGAIYGPPLILPVATNLKNPELVLSGITAALAGLAIGNYLGIAVAWVVRLLITA